MHQVLPKLPRLSGVQSYQQVLYLDRVLSGFSGGLVAALVLGIGQIASAEQTTVGKHFQTLNNNFIDVEVTDMESTTVTGMAPYPTIPFSKVTTQIPLVFLRLWVRSSRWSAWSIIPSLFVPSGLP